MKTMTNRSLIATILIAVPGIGAAETGGSGSGLRDQLEASIARGNEFLRAQQSEEGYWDDENVPAFTAFALTAALRDPNRSGSDEIPAYLERGFEWLLSQQKEDGGIYALGHASYNTASSIMALLARDKSEDVPAILKARAFLTGQQTDQGTQGAADQAYDGGTGYGSSPEHSDLSNTLFALEALHASRHLLDGVPDQPKLNWEAALTFVSRCQNLTATNDLDWASDNPQDRGGFIYYPGASKAGERELGDGRTALRSYGSISYAGLLSLVYADLDQNDPRVEAVLEWLGKNYTLEENPGMGLQGLYYYYQAMAKSLAAAQISELTLEDGSKVDWRKKLSTRLLALQQTDGSWINENSRWWENNPVLVTSYVVMALEKLHAAIEK